MSANIYADLPTVIYVISVEDHGTAEEGIPAATCPHCGAAGRYIYTFRCSDGSERSAMKICFSRFPQHSFCGDHAKVLKKEHENAKKGWKLASWDREIKDAIERFARGEMTEAEAACAIQNAKGHKSDYSARKGYRR